MEGGKGSRKWCDYIVISKKENVLAKGLNIRVLFLPSQKKRKQCPRGGRNSFTHLCMDSPSSNYCFVSHWRWHTEEHYVNVDGVDEKSTGGNLELLSSEWCWGMLRKGRDCETQWCKCVPRTSALTRQLTLNHRLQEWNQGSQAHKELRALEAGTKMFPVLVYFTWQTEAGIHDSPS